MYGFFKISFLIRGHKLTVLFLLNLLFPKLFHFLKVFKLILNFFVRLLLLLLLSRFSLVWLCDPIDGSPPGSPVPGILQAWTLEWVAISFSNAWKWKVKVRSLSHVQLSATPWTAAHQAPLSMGFSRQEYWSGVPLPSPCCIAVIDTWITKIYFEESGIQHFLTKLLPVLPTKYTKYTICKSKVLPLLSSKI